MIRTSFYGGKTFYLDWLGERGKLLYENPDDFRVDDKIADPVDIDIFVLDVDKELVGYL